MTPKEQYEARKAERQKWKDLDAQTRQRTEILAIFELFDRFITAHERIATSLENGIGYLPDEQP